MDCVLEVIRQGSSAREMDTRVTTSSAQSMIESELCLVDLNCDGISEYFSSTEDETYPCQAEDLETESVCTGLDWYDSI